MSERKYVFICKDGWIRTRVHPHGGGRFGRWLLKTPKIIDVNGEPMISVSINGHKGNYSLKGRAYNYDYRLLREFYRLFSHTYTGRMMFWFEGNPTPFNFNEDKWKSALDGTAYIVREVFDSDAPLKLMRPARIPWALVIMAGVMCLAIGLAAGSFLMR